MKIAFIATYPPEQCGIATFTENLLNSISMHFQPGDPANKIAVFAIQKDDELEYPPVVNFKIRQEILEDYLAAAKYINAEFDICIIQHEYGIFGGDSGIFILSLANGLTIPYIVTAHTVLKNPSVQQKSIMKSLAEKGSQVVVMSNKARQFLRDIYEIPAGKISIIEHGVPAKIPVDEVAVLSELGLKDRTMLMTFGLLGRNKGIETVIRALPKVVEKYPSVCYLVQGNTHPNVLRHEGDSYRESLIQLAEELGVSEHVRFRKGFMTEEELFKLLHSVDVYITPYNNEEQITSGTLSYALGAGAAILSTPYWHAQELLADNRGWLFGFRDHEQLSEMILKVLGNTDAADQLRSNALRYAHHLRWKNAGRRHKELLESILAHKHGVAQIKAATEFVEPGLRHIIKLTDNIGIFQHAVFGLPNYHEGYCLDDNARALMAMTLAAQQGFENETAVLADVYLSFIHFMQERNGWFHNFLSFERKIIDEECSEDAYGRTLWALGLLLSSQSFSNLHQPAEEIFIRAMHHATGLKHIRGMANTILGLQHFLEKNPFHAEAHELLHLLTDKLVAEYKSNRTDSWHWFADTLTYDNGIIPLALFHSYTVTGNEEAAGIACEATEFLEREMLGKGYLSLVGSNGWYTKGSTKAKYPQQAIDAMAMVLLFRSAYLHTEDVRYRKSMMRSYRWFFSENDLGISLYNPISQGCCDGLEDYGINRNQGAESTLAIVISHYAIRSITEADELKESKMDSEKIQ
ncbi:glycosyltransferase family 4 protein [soil metagenome]